MKKFIALGLSAIMATSLVGLVGCGEDDNPPDNKPTAVVEGNYTTLTEENAETFDAAISSIDSEKLFGDTESETWGIGASLFTDLYISIYEGENDYLKINLDTDIKLNIAKASEEDETSVAGMNIKAAGNASLVVDEKDTEEVSSDSEETPTIDIVNINASANAYIDNLTTYVDYSAQGTEEDEEVNESGAMKLSTLELLQMIMPGFGGQEEVSPTAADVEDGTNEGGDVVEETSSAEELLASLQPYGLTVGYEYSETTGLKLKISATEDTFADSEDTDVTVDKCTLDIYIVIDAQGMLSKVSLNADVKVTTTEEGVTTINEMSGIVVLDIGKSVKVEIPESLATDTKYEEKQLSE